MKEKAVVNARKINKMRFISGIAICSLVIAITLVVLALNLVEYFNPTKNESGLSTLRMFTTISNIIAAFAASMCLPFQIDGLRRDRYKLPSWIVLLMYVGAVGVFLTFTVAITIISAYQGFVKTMFSKSNLFMHTISPIMITFLFVLIIPNTRIKFSRSFIPLVPVAIYMFIYFIMVFVTKTWNDIYKTDAFIPWPVTLILLVTLTFGICQLLRVLHNLTHKHINKRIEEYYLTSPDFEYERIVDAIAYLAELESKFYYPEDDIVIPTDIIALLAIRYKANKLPLDILYDVYLENYLKDVHIKKDENN